MKWIDRIDGFAKMLERFVAGNAVNDPLYLSNRTLGQKVRLAALIATPLVLIGALIYVVFDKQLDRRPSVERAASLDATTSTESGAVTAKVLPNLDKTFSSEQSRDVDVLEAAVSHGSDPALSGRLRNNTDAIVRVADVVFDITDQEGSQLGAVSVRVENIAPKSVANFRVGLSQKGARSALVREVHSR